VPNDKQTSDSDDELTRLALKYPPPDDASLPAETNSSKSRVRPFLIWFFGLMSVLFTSISILAVLDFTAHGDHLLCRPGGCRPLSFQLAYSGLFALVAVVGFLLSLTRRT
jgi:hypothetical protein